MDHSVIIHNQKDASLTGQGTLVERYIQSLDVSPKSRETYRKSLKHFVGYLIDESIEEPTRNDILKYKQLLMQQYSACTVSSYMTAVRGLFTYLESERISPNIANGIKGAKSQKGFRKDALTIEQTKRILSQIHLGTVEGLRNYAIINLLVRTGLRTIEVERANIGDIRQEGGEALLYIQGKGRDSKDAFVVLTDTTLYPIQRYLKARGAIDPTAPLFASHSDRNKGGRLTTRSISGIAKETMRNVGIDSPRLTAHSLRHTAITFSLISGATIQEAQGFARHSDVNTTLIYAHNLDRIANAPERKIDSLLAI